MNLQEPKKVNGAKFVVAFILFSAVVALVFAKVLIQAYQSRPQVEIKDDGKNE